jgi:hypothetical protein
MLALLCVRLGAASAAQPMTSYMYGEERVEIPDPSAVTYGAAANASACTDVRQHMRYTGHDVAGDPTPGVQTETMEDCCVMCNANAKCAHVTYNGHTCYMKTSSVAPAQPTALDIQAASRVGPLPPAPPSTPPYSGDLPNLVFLIVESTDGRTYHEDSDAYMVCAAIVPLLLLPPPPPPPLMLLTPPPLQPNIRGLQKKGAYFKNFYSSSPVCAASRTSVWSGRHVHRALD